MANKVNLRICLAIVVCLLLMTGLTQAATITVGIGVDYDFDTIQAGIDTAVDGDTVQVAPGEYVISEPVTFRGKTITVRSEAGPDETAIRMGTPADSNHGSVVVFENNETADSVLDGFTITGGGGFWIPTYNTWAGGGIFFDASSATVRNCAIVQNNTKQGGGVMVASGSTAILINCEIVQNIAKNGGGVMVNISSSMTLTDCIIKDNSATGITFGVDGYGGGLFCGMSSLLTLTNCTIAGNSAVRGGGGVHCWQNLSMNLTNCVIISNTVQYAGGGVLSDSGSAILANCVIARNTDATWGGGLCSFGNSSVTIRNCTISENSATEGGGVGCYSGGSMTVTNSILQGNIAERGSEIYLERAPTEFKISHTNIVSGQAAALVEGGSTLDWGVGNIEVDPLFANPGYWTDVNDPNVVVEPNDPNAVWIDGDYHLKSEAGRWDPVSESWVVDDVTSPCIDNGDPNMPVGDELEPNGGRINMGAYGGTAEASKSPAGAQEIVYIQWLGHASVKVWTDDCIVYVDPQNLNISPHDAAFVLVTHTHSDHYSPSDIARVSNTQTQFIAPPDVVQLYGSGLSIAPWQTMEFDFVKVMAVPAYNINKTNHPKSNNWVGYIVELSGKRIYVAGDTDLIEEMKSLGDIDVAFLPAGGTYTMNTTEAAEATGYIKPDLAIPYHWGQVVGTLADAQRFVELARCPAMVMAVGETISSDNWPEYSPLIAHWAFDETEGDIAHDSAGDNNGTLFGEPTWQPDGGKIDGALLLDGIDDYINTDFVLDPANGPFSVFAWIKGGSAGQVVVSQADGTGSGEIWLGADALLGKLMTGLVPPPAGRFVPQPLVSEFVITGDQWHHIGFAWDGSYRTLYVDGAEVAKDAAAQNTLKPADGGLYVGAGKTLEPTAFFSGPIDDVRIYNVALSAEEIEALIH